MDLMAWELQQGYLTMSDINSELCIPWISINPISFRFFYVWKTPFYGLLQADAVSFVASNNNRDDTAQGKALHITTGIQSFGRLEEYEVGMIFANRLSQPGQLLTLLLSIQKGNDTSWSLPILKQHQKEAHTEAKRMSIPGSPLEKYFPEIELHGPVRKEQVCYFRKKTPGKSIPDMPCICFRIDDPTIVKTISQTDFITIAGKQNFGL